ncbi:jg5236 [Pararge aegeria aegeria]|uniref:Jg5236 protein n=1 Tax=Pararge aegeria aegeria TaxID=348720 RepID=A0A8S4RE47_9NEOP|nr:jg5236 [Pararge aegeria aegeria]
MNTQTLKNIHVHIHFGIVEIDPQPWAHKAVSLPTAPISRLNFQRSHTYSYSSATARRQQEKVSHPPPDLTTIPSARYPANQDGLVAAGSSTSPDGPKHKGRP